MNLRIGPISRLLRPGYGSCLRCGTNWGFVEGHTIWFSDHEGMFALCEKCWAELTPERRLDYCWTLWMRWTTGSDRSWEDWKAIKKAVLEGR